VRAFFGVFTFRKVIAYTRICGGNKAAATTEPHDMSKTQLALIEAQKIAGQINQARFSGTEITDEQTVRLCELLDILDFTL
jgi:hypothetical protein